MQLSIGEFYLVVKFEPFFQQGVKRFSIYKKREENNAKKDLN